MPAGVTAGGSRTIKMAEGWHDLASRLDPPSCKFSEMKSQGSKCRGEMIDLAFPLSDHKHGAVHEKRDGANDESHLRPRGLNYRSERSAGADN